MIINILSGLGEYPVELPDDVTINDLPGFIQAFGGIVVPFEEEGRPPGNLFLPASQIQGITWYVEKVMANPVDDADLAEVSFIGEEEPGDETLAPGIEDPGVVPAPTGPNGEVFIDA